MMQWYAVEIELQGYLLFEDYYDGDVWNDLEMQNINNRSMCLNSNYAFGVSICRLPFCYRNILKE